MYKESYYMYKTLLYIVLKESEVSFIIEKYSNKEYIILICTGIFL